MGLIRLDLLFPRLDLQANGEGPNLMVLTCQGGAAGKLILRVEVGAGTASETVLYGKMLTEMRLRDDAFLVDNAFHSAL